MMKKLMKKKYVSMNMLGMKIKGTERASKVGFTYINFVIAYTTGNYTSVNKIVVMICTR